MTVPLKRAWKRGILVAAAIAVAAAVIPTLATGTKAPLEPAITLDASIKGGELLPLINSGDRLGKFVFEGLPDGLGLRAGPDEYQVAVFVNHEQSTVPFRGAADFVNSSVSELIVDTKRGVVIRGTDAIPASAGLLRLCSAFLAGEAEGFATDTFFTGEETNAWINRKTGEGISDPDWQALEEKPPGFEQAGVVVAHNAETGESRIIYGMGRMNHENTVAIPGGWKNKFALITTDDTFSAPSSQLYMYVTTREEHIWEDKGDLWAFRVTKTGAGHVDRDDPFNNANDYLDIQPGDKWKGQFIRVPREVALGDQQALEDWSNENNVFQFIRLEDLAYDRNNPRVVYVADTGVSRLIPDEETGRLKRYPSANPDGLTGMADNGRIYRFELSKWDPRRVKSFSVLADGDADPKSPYYVDMTSPDNIDTSKYSLMVQEDTSNAKILRYDFRTEAWSTVATVNDPAGESSGIVDASQWFGPGYWMLTVQEHGSNNKEEMVSEDLTLKREDGQLLVMKVPGS